MKISWVNRKEINIEETNKDVLECVETKHFTNGGKNVLLLQERIKKLFEIESEKEVLLVCNGAMGIQALIGGLNIFYNRELKWAVQSFTFPCSKQGLLLNSLVLDLDENMGPNISELEKYKDEYDGVLITNCFGCSVNIDLYQRFCSKYNKLLLFDNAAASLTYYNGKNHLNYGIGCMVSLHHTKPIGFGEGGFIVFDKKYLESMKRTICFGYTETNKLEYNMYANNCKMSEISSIYINNYLNNLNKIYEHHTRIVKYFIKKIKENDIPVELYKNYSNYEVSLLSTIPILFKKKISMEKFLDNKIEAKKYYYPLDKKNKISNELFEHIICLPLNLDISEEIIDKYINIIKELK